MKMHYDVGDLNRILDNSGAHMYNAYGILAYSPYLLRSSIRSGFVLGSVRPGYPSSLVFIYKNAKGRELKLTHDLLDKMEYTCEVL